MVELVFVNKQLSRGITISEVSVSIIILLLWAVPDHVGCALADSRGFTSYIPRRSSKGRGTPMMAVIIRIPIPPTIVEEPTFCRFMLTKGPAVILANNICF